MLEVVDGEAQGLVSLKEAVDHVQAQPAEPGAAAFGGMARVEAVRFDRRAQVVEHLQQQLGPAPERVAGFVVVEGGRKALEPAGGLARGEEELAIAAVLGWVEVHGVNLRDHGPGGQPSTRPAPSVARTTTR